MFRRDMNELLLKNKEQNRVDPVEVSVELQFAIE